MIQLLQSEYDDLLAAQAALAIVRQETTLPGRCPGLSIAVRCKTAKLLAEHLLADVRSMGLHLTIERHTHGAPSMDGIGYVIEAWPDQRKAAP